MGAAAARPKILVTAEMMNDAKVQELGEWAYSIVTPVAQLGMTAPALGAVFPTHPARKNSVVVFGNGGPGWPNAWGTTEPKASKVETVARDFVVVVGGCFRPGGDTAIPLTMGDVRVATVSTMGEVVTVKKVLTQDGGLGTRPIRLPQGVESAVQQLSVSAIRARLQQVREGLQAAAGGMAGGAQAGAAGEAGSTGQGGGAGAGAPPRWI